MIDTSGAETVLGGLMTLTDESKRVLDRDAHVLVLNLAVVGIGMTEDADVTNDVDARRVGGNDDLGHAARGRVLPSGIDRSTHDDEEVGVDAVRREPLVTVDHPVVAVADSFGHDGARIGSGVIGLGHREPGLHLSSNERQQPFALLLLGSVLHQDAGVARIRRSDAEKGRGADAVGEDLVHVGQ